jgi:hypothetical protein
MKLTANQAQLITTVCAGYRGNFLKAARRHVGKAVRHAVRDRDTPALFAWLMQAFSYQGIADAVATAYLDAHGSVTLGQVARRLKAAPDPRCPKLAGFDAYHGCGYRKAAQTCSHPATFPTCPVPTHDLRRGTLNQAAYSLYFFVRDVAGGDLVGLLDGILGQGDPVPVARDAVVAALRRVFGVSDKVVHMTLGELLIGADPKREPWVATGQGMIAVDTLVHNFLHRTGILRTFRASHPYGACYRNRGCFQVLDAIAHQIDASQFHPAYPAYFPRFIQSALWHFCAANGRGVCNGRNIDDSRRCAQTGCPVYGLCGRVVLKSGKGSEGR